MGWHSGHIGAESRHCLTMQNRRAYPLQTPYAAGLFMGRIAGLRRVMDVLKKAGSVRAASDAVLTGYEKPADQRRNGKEKVQSTARVIIKVCSGKQSLKRQSARAGRTQQASWAFIAGKCKRALARRAILWHDDNGKAVYIPQRGSRQAQAFRLSTVNVLTLAIRTGAKHKLCKTGETTGKGVLPL